MTVDLSAPPTDARTILELLADPDAPVSILDAPPSDWAPPRPGAYIKDRWWHRADRPGAKPRLKRRAFPIRAYCGPNGTGKSAIAVMDAIPSLLARRFVMSTVRLLDFESPRPCPGGLECDDPDGHHRLSTISVPTPGEANHVTRFRVATGKVHPAAHPYYIPFRSYAQLRDAVDCDVIADEVTGFASSRESTNMPPEIANLLVQLRRRNLTLSWTTPAWGRADKIIREVTQLVTLMSARFGVRRAPAPGEAPRLWKDNRLLIARSYDPSTMEEFEAHRAEFLPVEIRGFYWRPHSLMERAYDTLDAVSALGWADVAGGACLNCGGKRSISKCSCDDHRERGSRDARRAEAPRAAVRHSLNVPPAVTS